MTKFKFLRKRSDYYRHFTVLDIGTDLIKVLVVRRDGIDGEVLGSLCDKVHVSDDRADGRGDRAGDHDAERQS